MKTGRLEPTDLETLRQARPYLRSAIALVLYVTRSYQTDPDISIAEPLIPALYQRADAFLDHLTRDLNSRGD